MLDSTEALLGQALGFAIVALLFLLPIVLTLRLTKARWFTRRRRVHWAGERLLWWKDAMSDLPAPLGDEPTAPKRRER